VPVQADEPVEALAPAAEVAETMPTPAAEVRIVDMGERPAQEKEIASEPKMTNESGHEFDSSARNSGGASAGTEHKTTALSVWKSENHGTSVASDLGQAASAPTAISAAPEAAKKPEFLKQSAAEQYAELEENFEILDEVADAGHEGLPVASVEEKSAEPTLLSFHGLR